MSQRLQHKGYDGSVEYSAEDRLLHGALLGIRDAVVYQGSDVFRATGRRCQSRIDAALRDYMNGHRMHAGKAGEIAAGNAAAPGGK